MSTDVPTTAADDVARPRPAALTARRGFKRLAISTAASAAAEAVNRALPLATMSIAQARLGTAGFGRALFSVSYVDCSSPFIEAGTASFGQIRIGAAEDPEARRVVLGDVLAVRCLNLVVTALVLGLVTALRYQEYASLILATSIIMLPSSALDMSYYHVGTQRVWILSTLAVISKVLLLGAVFFGVHGSGDQRFFAAALVAGNSVISLGAAAVAVRGTRPRLPSLERVRSLYARILPFAVTVVLFYGIDKFDFLLVGAVAGPTDVGLYGGASRLFTSIQALVAPLALAAGAEMLGTKEPDALRKFSQIALGLVSLVVLPIAAGAWFVGGPLLALLFDKTYLAAGPVFAMLCTAAAPFAFLVVYGTYILQPHGRLRRFCLALAGGMASGVALALALWPALGLLGIALGAAGGKLVAAFLAYLGVDPAQRRVDLACYWVRNLAAALAMALALAVVRPPGLFPTIAAGAGVYAVVVLLLNRGLVRRLAARLRRAAP